MRGGNVNQTLKKITKIVHDELKKFTSIIRKFSWQSPTDHPDMLLPAMLEEFPFLHVSPQTAHSMWDKQARHLSSFLKSGADANRTKTQRMIEEAEKRQKALVGILRKDVEHNMRMVKLYFQIQISGK